MQKLNSRSHENSVIYLPLVCGHFWMSWNFTGKKAATYWFSKTRKQVKGVKDRMRQRNNEKYGISRYSNNIIISSFNSIVCGHPLVCTVHKMHHCIFAPPWECDVWIGWLLHLLCIVAQFRSRLCASIVKKVSRCAFSGAGKTKQNHISQCDYYVSRMIIREDLSHTQCI